MVEVDACVVPELLLDDGVHFQDPARRTGDADVVQESEQLLIPGQSCLGFDEGLMLAQNKEHEVIALLPSPCAMFWVTPNSSSHR